MGTERTSTKIRVASTGRLGVRRAAILTLLVVGSTSVSAQESSEYRGTPDQQMACIGDVFRLCSSEIPDVSRIVGCLVREKSNLTIECRAVFDRDAPRTASNHWLRHHRRAASAMGRRSVRYGRRND
jgi:hypothetical protein